MSVTNMAIFIYIPILVSKQNSRTTDIATNYTVARLYINGLYIGFHVASALLFTLQLVLWYKKSYKIHTILAGKLTTFFKIEAEVSQETYCISLSHKPVNYGVIQNIHLRLHESVYKNVCGCSIV